MHKLLMTLAATLLASVLCACGGGGGGGSTTASGWSEQAYLKASNAEAGDTLGISIAVDGDTLVVGAPGEDSDEDAITNGDTASSDNTYTDSGAAYVYVRSGGVWTQQAYLKASNGDAGDNFGFSVAISGDTIVVGAYKEDSSGAVTNNSATDAGAAYVFTRSNGVWTQQAYLKASNAGAGDNFGRSVAIAGDTIVVGATGEDSSQNYITNASSGTVAANNAAADAGAAYVFLRDSGGVWTQQAYLKANTVAGANFGQSVAISGDTIAVGANGQASGIGGAYVFARSGTDWSLQADLFAPNGEAGDNYGSSVAISGDTLVVGALGEDSNQTTITNGSSASSDNLASASGAAYVWTRSGTSWSQQAYLKAANAGANDQFGIRVAIDADTIVVGANEEASSQTTITNGSGASSDDSASETGAAYVFTRSGTSWSEQAYLKAANAGEGDLFGRAVAVGGNTIAVGAPTEDSSDTTITNGSSASNNDASGSENVGAAYVFGFGN